MKDEEAKYLLDALEACNAIDEFLTNRSFEEYENNKMLRSAVERQFEILGEAMNQLDHINPEYRRDNPEIGAIVGMRNRIIHGYDSVDDRIIWDAVHNHLPDLHKWLRSFPL